MVSDGQTARDYGYTPPKVGTPEYEWAYTPSCPCDRCEDYRRDNGMTCMYGIGPRPETERQHRGWDAPVQTVKPTPGLGP